MILKVKKLHPEAKIPTRAHASDAGIDFYAIEEAVFPPKERVNIKTGIAVEIPEGYVGFIWDKSGVSFNLGLKVMGGVIDAGYRGEMIICLFNTSDKEVVVEKGRKIIQMIVQKFEHCDIQEVSDLSETPRGNGREGSTGHL
ncbi:MAG: dUTP diphosphatase [Candidatus Pacebacteria bacterium]|nr:dUTP diphosphatase [Candidatus Paceibacterota bacterium]MCF7862646.1 dUTP diphosphatase [Candidatus Paceibacterota bacterium]